MDTKPRTASVARSYEEFKPTTELVPGEAFDTFIIRFRKEHLRVQVDSQGNLRTSGERPLDATRWSRFVVEFKLPENCSLSDVRAKFENETLLVRFPKLIAPEPVVQIEEREEEEKKKLQPPKEEKDVPAKSNGDKEMVPRTETGKVKEKDVPAKSNGDKEMVPRTETGKVKEKDVPAKSNGDKEMVPRTETEKVKEKDEAAKSNGDKEMVSRTETGKVKEKDEAAKSNGDKKMVPRTETEKVKEKDEAAKSNGDKEVVPRTETEKEESSSKEKVEDKKLNGEKTKARGREEPEKEKEEVKDDKEKVELSGGGARAERPAWQELGGIIMELSRAGKSSVVLWKLAAAMLVLLVLVLFLKHQLTQAEETRSASL
ncbi:hypothetical protein BHE74_00032364 [Ensete ventricosum]|nr:hypothetical protein BHE74_00032364 [Ensete ventricosum]